MRQVLYTFLGVDYNHREKPVKLSERFTKKMTSADAWENLSMPGCETLFPRCVYASTILKIAGRDFYHIYKFMTRRISAMTLPNSAANVWESIRSPWSEWIKKCPTETRQLKPPSPLETQINAPRLYTDASNAGWGAMFFISAIEVSYCGGSWSQHWLDTSINVREAKAAHLGIQQLASQEQPWHLRVHNTSVVYALAKATHPPTQYRGASNTTHSSTYQPFERTLRQHERQPSRRSVAPGVPHTNHLFNPSKLTNTTKQLHRRCQSTSCAHQHDTRYG
jgi:hypothetical protein